MVGKIENTLLRMILYQKNHSLHSGFQLVEELIVIPFGINAKTINSRANVKIRIIRIFLFIVVSDFATVNTKISKKMRDKQST